MEALGLVSSRLGNKFSYTIDAVKVTSALTDELNCVAFPSVDLLH